MNAIHTQLADWWRQFTCRLQEARRVRRDLRELAQMGAHELRDLGLSHAAVAAMTPRGALSCA